MAVLICCGVASHGVGGSCYVFQSAQFHQWFVSSFSKGRAWLPGLFKGWSCLHYFGSLTVFITLKV